MDIFDDGGYRVINSVDKTKLSCNTPTDAAPQFLQKLTPFTLYPELFAENIKFEYISPICKEVLDHPVETNCPIPHIFCARCLSFSMNMCRLQCSSCIIVMQDPKDFVEPAPQMFAQNE